MRKMIKNGKFVAIRIIAMFVCCSVVFSACASHRTKILLNYKDDGSANTPITEYKIVKETDYSNLFPIYNGIRGNEGFSFPRLIVTLIAFPIDFVISLPFFMGFQIVDNENIYGNLKLHGMLADRNNNPVRYHRFDFNTTYGYKFEIFSDHKGVFDEEISLNSSRLKEDASFSLLFDGTDIRRINYSAPFLHGDVYKNNSNGKYSIPAEGNIIEINPR